MNSPFGPAHATRFAAPTALDPPTEPSQLAIDPTCRQPPSPPQKNKTPTNPPGSEEYPPDCRSYEEFFVPCKAGPEAAANVCGLSGDDAEGIASFAR